jgi:monoamine oxidase
VHRSRYPFLRIVPVALLAVATACASQPSPRPAAPAAAGPKAAGHSYDVIIVGAGMAGLTAGKNLLHAGRSFVILEATDRIGGRGRTDATTFSAPIDLGGAWIHDLKTNPLTPIVTGSGYATQATDVDASHHLFFNHHFARPEERERFERIAESFEESLTKSPGHDDAAAEHLPREEPGGKPAMPAAPGEPAFEQLRELVALNSGPLESAVELEESSTVDAGAFLAGDDVLVQRGYGTFVEEYGQEVLPEVRLRSPVTRITRDGGGVTAETKQGERFSGRMALVTVSTGVLAAGKIRFEPELPAAKMAAIRGLPMGLLDKVILEFSTPDVFPRQDGVAVENAWLLYGGDLDRRDDDMAFVFRPMGTLIAIGFFGGKRAWELEKLPNHGRERMIELALAAMSDMCGCDAGRALVQSRTTDWGADEWTLGAYSAALPGQAAMRQKLAEPIDHQLYFAGEACDYSPYNGSFAGAYNSALKSSYQMITCLRHQDRHEACP